MNVFHEQVHVVLNTIILQCSLSPFDILCREYESTVYRMFINILCDILFWSLSTLVVCFFSRIKTYRTLKLNVRRLNEYN